jgi:hypothetical protein
VPALLLPSHNLQRHTPQHRAAKGGVPRPAWQATSQVCKHRGVAQGRTTACLFRLLADDRTMRISDFDKLNSENWPTRSIIAHGYLEQEELWEAVESPIDDASMNDDQHAMNSRAIATLCLWTNTFCKPSFKVRSPLTLRGEICERSTNSNLWPPVLTCSASCATLSWAAFRTVAKEAFLTTPAVRWPGGGYRLLQMPLQMQGRIDLGRGLVLLQTCSLSLPSTARSAPSTQRYRLTSTLKS